jgi:hypothetical protein
MKITKLPNGGELQEDSDGNKEWYLNGNLHREDGPAVENDDGSKWWYLNGKLHREDGPASEGVNGDKYWYINDKHVPCKTQEEFERVMKLKAFW